MSAYVQRLHGSATLLLRRHWATATALPLLVVAAAVGAVAIDKQPLVGVGLPALLGVALLFSRFPALGVLSAFVFTGFAGTVRAYAGVSVGPGVDFLLGALWAATLLGYAVRRRERPFWFWPGVVACIAYLAVTAVSILVAPSPLIGLIAFRDSGWYMMVFLLVAYAGWPPATFRRIAQGIVVVAAAVGAYAMLRWATGPTTREYISALTSAGRINLVDDQFRVVGPFGSGHELGAWSALAVPFCGSCALLFRGWWRVLAGTAAAACAAAAVASQSRIAVAAVASGIVVLLSLYHLSRAFPGPRLAVSAVVIAFVFGGAAAFLMTTQDVDRKLQRYSALVSPSEDTAFNARTMKWETALDEIQPLGRGLGTAGRAQEEYGRSVTIGGKDLDNAYLRIAYEQGPLVTLLFGIAVLLLLFGVGRRAGGAADPQRAALAMGAAGTLTAFLVLLITSVYTEGLIALAAWTIVGIGVGQFAQLEGREGRAAAAGYRTDRPSAALRAAG